MKIVIDTSVWVSALISKDGHARKLLRYVFQKKIHPQISEALFREYEDVIERKKIQDLCYLKPKEQKELFQAYLSTCKWNEIYYMWRPNLKDENDNFIVELAVASGAKYIITYNTKDFKNSELHFQYRVLTPENFLKEM